MAFNDKDHLSDTIAVPPNTMKTYKGVRVTLSHSIKEATRDFFPLGTFPKKPTTFGNKVQLLFPSL